MRMRWVACVAQTWYEMWHAFFIADVHDAMEWKKNDEKNVRSDFNEKHQYCMTEPYIIICRAYACGIALGYWGVLFQANKKYERKKLRWMKQRDASSAW